MIQPIYILYGVSGSGKSSVGNLLANHLEIPFYDADDYHPKENIVKMSSGIPLTDEDRYGWLVALNSLILREQKKGLVLACSALKESYRELISRNTDCIHWVLLDGAFDLIKQRIQRRENHFMGDALLQSQFDTLQRANYGIILNISQTPEQLVEKIMEHTTKYDADLGVIGLGVMGRNLALNLLDHQWKLAVYNRPAKNESHLLDNFLKDAKEKSVQGFTSFEPFVAALKGPRVILLMVTAGVVVDQIIEQLLPFLSAGDLLIDGGNSHYLDTKRRVENLKEHDIDFIGMGVSGGEKGARFGPAIMPGGARQAYHKIEKIVTSIAAKNRAKQACCQYIGKSGAGHFVKMIHNGIEYAEMALIAEIYGLLRRTKSNEEIAQFLSTLNQGETQSYLLEISIVILRKQENNSFVIDQILDKAGNKGTGGWSIKAAMDLGQAATMMAAAVHARFTSSYKAQRTKYAHKKNASNEVTIALDDTQISNIYQAARIINHHQGFEVIRSASMHYDWDINLSNVCNVWTNGCIIRSELMEKSAKILAKHTTLLEDEKTFEHIKDSIAPWKSIVKKSLDLGESIPVFSSGLQYWLAMTSEHSNANMIQAQRDYFGAHTYERKDNPGIKVHTHWE